MFLARLEWCVVVFAFYGPMIAVAAIERYFSTPDQGTQAAVLVEFPDAVNDLLYFLPRLAILAFLVLSAGLERDYVGRMDRRTLPRVVLLVLADRLLGHLVGGIPAFPLRELSLGFSAFAHHPVPLLLTNLVWLTCGALFEEFTRAYVIDRAGDAWGSRVFGAVVSAALFTLSHSYYTDSWTLAAVALQGGVLYSLAYLWWKDVWALVVVHLAVNVFITVSSAASA